MLMIMEWTVKICTPNCLHVIQLDESINTAFSEIYFPPRSLPYGIYKLQLTITTNTSSPSTNTAFTFVKIIPSDIQVNLIRLGTSMITHSYQQDLKLDPGTYSIDFNGYEFNASVCFNKEFVLLSPLVLFYRIGYMNTIAEPMILPQRMSRCCQLTH